MSKDNPIHGSEHEEGFTYLGSYASNGYHYDLWHGPDICGPTVVARWSPDGPDYSSGMCFGCVLHQPRLLSEPQAL